MPKRSDARDNEKIKALRMSLRFTQLQFSQALDVTQPTISAWENGSEIPSREAYVRMGNVAQYPEDLWFWEKGGVDIGSAKVSIYRELQAEAPTVSPGKLVLIPMNVMTEKGLKETGKPIPFSQELIENPFSTVCLIINYLIAGGTLSAGDVVLLDPSSDKNRASLRAQRVLFKFPARDQRTIDHGRHWPSPGLYVGTLTFQDWRNDGSSWIVKFDDDLVGYLEGGPEGHISLYDGCEILGRVSGCFFKREGKSK
jgi:transcriptional regulator with XRE-family HTH domain